MNERVFAALRAGLWVVLAAAGPLLFWAQFDRLRETRVDGVSVLYDDHDITSYFYASRWVIGEGVLYRDFSSEYPPAANLLFGTARALGAVVRPFPDPHRSFVWACMSLGWVAYVGLVRRALIEQGWGPAALLLHPGVLFFTLYRFDLFLLGTTYLALAAARRDQLLRAAGWLGFAVALKGYPLFVWPAFVAFVWRRAGARRAALAGAVVLAPAAFATACVLGYAGIDGAAGPYRFHAVRGFDSASSTYDAAQVAFGWKCPDWLEKNPRVPLTAALAVALSVGAAVAARPRLDPFTGLTSAGLVALGALTSLSLFYSPQFALWLVPFVMWSGSRAVRATGHVYLLVTTAHFPYAFGHRIVSGYAEPAVQFLSAVVVALAVCRLALMALGAWRLCSAPPPADP